MGRRPKLTGICRAPLVLLVVALAVACPQGVQAAVEIPEEQFCVEETLRDYEAPLAKLPNVREAPVTGQLPFGPNRLRLSPGPTDRFVSMGSTGYPIPAPLVVAGDGLGYRLWAQGAKRGPLRLGWEVDSRLVQVDRAGRSLRLAKRNLEQVRVVRSGAPRELGFARSPGPGLYRHDLLLRAADGGLLGHYHHHFRVLKRNPEVRLSLNGSSFRPGEALRARVENPGTENLFYGVGFWLERFDGTVWSPVPLKEFFGTEHDVAFILIGLTLQRGTADKCWSGFTIPQGTSTGLYRISKSVDLHSSRLWSARDDRQAVISAEFTVEPTA